MKLDVLAIGAHPDDVELGAAGTLAILKARGYATGILDLTQGDLGTRGTVETRELEAREAAAVLGLEIRENLKFADGFFVNEEGHQRALITQIRRFQPEIVLLTAPEDRHPDHGRAAQLGRDACWLSGLRRIETFWNDLPQTPWRPKKILHYIQDRYLRPSIVVDITDHWQTKLKAIHCFSSQVFTQQATTLDEPETYISRPVFMQQLEARALEMGHAIGTTYGEGFISLEPLKVSDITALATVL